MAHLLGNLGVTQPDGDLRYRKQVSAKGSPVGRCKLGATAERDIEPARP